MANPPKAAPSFFKILIGDFSKQLTLPPAFINKFDGRSLTGKIINIKSPTGKYWPMKMEKNDNRLCFTSGWLKFVKDHSLEAGDFLVFKYKGKSEFKAKIFDRSASEKIIELPEINTNGRVRAPEFRTEQTTANPNKNGCANSREGQVIDEQGNKPKTMSIREFKSENPCFAKTCGGIKPPYLTVPRKFAVDQGLVNRESIKLVDPSGNSWTIKLRERDHRLDMIEKLGDFWRANQIGRGDTLVFELTKPNIMQVHVFQGDEKTATSSSRTRIFEASGL